MHLIHEPLFEPEEGARKVLLHIDRLHLAKRRWRGVAEDGVEFGFDLEHPLKDGAPFFEENGCVYCVSQKPEPVIEVPLPSSPQAAAQLGWLLGNLHFQLEVAGDALRTADDPAIRQLLHREHLGHRCVEAVFRPLSGGHSHAH